MARKLGLDPRSLLHDDRPRFVWNDRTKYKRLATESDVERNALASFGSGIARILLAASPNTTFDLQMSARSLRSAILAHQQSVRLLDLVALCWGVGLPVAYLRVFPLNAKRMSAMSVRVGDRYAILLGREARYPAQAAYYVAHELGHIAVGHLSEGAALIDFGDALRTGKNQAADEEETVADRYALEVLTGDPEPTFTTEAKSFLASDLADVAIRSAPELRTEPGTIILCFAHNTGRWDKAFAAMRHLYRETPSPWGEINAIADTQLSWDSLSRDGADYLRSVLGLT